MAKPSQAQTNAALQLLEAVTAMSHDDIRQRVSDALRDAYKASGYWCYVVAVFGDDQSGEFIYSCDDGLKKASYTCSKNGATVDIAAAVDVVPLTTYEVEGTLTEAGARNSKRDLAQLQAIHDAAMNLGASCPTKESAKNKTGDSLKLVESSNWKHDEALHLIESSGGAVRMPIKLIAPGKGSSAIYPAEVLKRDGPNVFTKGTHIYINHATSAEEAARPEGDWHKLAGALESNAYWDDNGKKGPGLYADALFTSDYAPLVKEKAAFTGMSIRAAGIAESGKKQDGLPILKELTHAESVDVVTRPGAGGMILTEAARTQPGNPQEVEMTEQQITALVESAVTKAVAAVQAPVQVLERRALRGDAVVEANKILSPLALKESAKQLIVDNVLRDEIPVKEGALDVAKFTELVNAEAKKVAAVLSEANGSGRVVGMGPSAQPETDPAKIAEAKKRADDEAKQLVEAEEDAFSRLTGIRVKEKAA